MQNLKIKFRLYPTKSQEIRLNQIAGSDRFTWNHYLAKEIDQYKLTKKFNFLSKNSADLTALKKATDTVWLADSPSTSLQQTLCNLDRALKVFFKRKNAGQGFPKFKTKKNFARSFTLAMVNAKRNIKDQNHFYIPKIGQVKCKYHRDIPSDFKSCQIKQEGDRWFVVLTCSKEQSQLPKTGKETGIDLNSKEYVTSDGNRYQIPKYLKEKQFQIKHLQRNLSRKQKGSANRKKAQLKLVKVHQSVANKRLDYFHKLSKTLVTNYDLIALEDLDVKDIQQKMGHVIKDNGFAMFRSMIVYKAALYGKESVIIDRWYPSSQLCSQCGTVHKMPLSVRVYNCPDCGMIMDRDLNASKNIMKAGTASRVVKTDTNAFGEVDYMGQTHVLTILAGLNEEGSHVL